MIQFQILLVVFLFGFLAFLFIGVAKRWLETGNLSTKRSAFEQPRDRETKPIRYWFFVVQAFSTGAAFAVVALLVITGLVFGSILSSEGAQ